jgi:RNA-binding protein PNO1
MILLQKLTNPRFAIETATKTRISVQDTKIHLLGAFNNIAMAKTTVVDLIRGIPPAKAYQNLRTISTKLKEQF